MTRRSARSWLGAAVFLLGATAQADERALFVAPGLASNEAVSVAAALRTVHSVEAIDEARARVLLTGQAAALPPDRVAEATAAALDEAEQAWADLHLDGARAILDRALSALLGAPRPPSTTLVARALFVRSLIDDAAGRRLEAGRALDAALALDDSLTPSPDRHGPPVARAVDAARQRGRAAPDAALRITVTPESADVEVDGAPTTAREVRVATGPHLVVARHLGHRPTARLVEVAGAAACAMSLEPAPAALAATQALASLEAGAPFRDVAPVAARALGISRVFEAVAGEAGALELRVYGASGERVATLPDPRLPTATEVARRTSERSRSSERLRASERPSRAWLWIGGGAVAVVVAAVTTVLLLGAQDPEVVHRITVTGPP